MQTMVLGGLAQGLILFLVHLPLFDGIKLSFLKNKKKKDGVKVEADQ